MGTPSNGKLHRLPMIITIFLMSETVFHSLLSNFSAKTLYGGSSKLRLGVGQQNWAGLLKIGSLSFFSSFSYKKRYRIKIEYFDFFEFFRNNI